MQEVFLKKEDMDFRMKEAFKIIRTNIEFSGEDVKVICVTSCTPNEGKSLTSFEVAKSFAEIGKKTLLIDADLRKSVMRDRYEAGVVKYGLTNFLAGKVSLDEALCKTDVPGLTMFFAGPVPPNPSELLGSKKFTTFIEKAREHYDMIIIDTPPLGSVIDTAVVSKCCDGAVIIIASGTVSYRFVRKVKQQLEFAGCRILGCVLNKVDIGGNKYYGKYYGRYYGKYYGNYSQNELGGGLASRIFT